VLPLKDALRHYLSHREQVVERRTRFELRKAQERAHILEGLLIALSNLDQVINLIRRSQSPEEARTGLKRQFNLSEPQAQAILDMRLQRLTALEREKIQQEHQELLEEIQRLALILEDRRQLWRVIKGELKEAKQRFADARRTLVQDFEAEISKEDLIAEEDCVITVSRLGYVKRLALESYRSQLRGGKGSTAAPTEKGDFVENLFIGSTHHYLLFFTDTGMVYKIKIYDIPEADRYARGTHVRNLLSLKEDEAISSVLAIDQFDREGYLVVNLTQELLELAEA